MTGTTDGCCDDVPLKWSGDPTAISRVGIQGFVALWRGEHPVVLDLAGDPTIVDAMAHAGRLEMDDRGRLMAVHGLVSRPTRHRIEHDGGSINTWCALDAIGIPAALAIDATAVTSCPACEAELRVELRQGVDVESGSLRLWLPGGRCDHLVDDFCNHANLYCDNEHLRSVVSTDRPGRVVTVAEVTELGRQSWADVAEAVDADACGRP